MSNSRRKLPVLTYFLLFAAFFIFAFQNCDPTGSSGFASKITGEGGGGGGGGNGQGYDGKVYVNLSSTTCNDGSAIDSAIVFHGDKAYLKRDHCQDISEVPVIVVLNPLTPTSLIYNNRTYFEKLAIFFDKDVNANGELLASIRGFNISDKSLKDGGWSVARYTSSGQLKWAKTNAWFGDTSQYLRTHYLPDGSVIVAGHSDAIGESAPVSWLAKLDTNGNLQWSKALRSPSEPGSTVNSGLIHVLSITADNQSQIYIGGHIRYADQTATAVLYKFANNGDLIYAKKVDASHATIISITIAPDGTPYFSGVAYGSLGSSPPFLLQVDSLGNLIASKSYSTLSANLGGLHLKFSATGSAFTLAGFVTKTEPVPGVELNVPNYRMLKIESDGSIIGTYKFGDGLLPISSLLPSTDGGFFGTIDMSNQNTGIFHLTNNMTIDFTNQKLAHDGLSLAELSGTASDHIFAKFKKQSSLPAYHTDLVAKVSSTAIFSSCVNCAALNISISSDTNPPTTIGPNLSDEPGLSVHSINLPPFSDSIGFLSITNKF